MKNRVDYTKYINYIIIIYAFFLPTSRAIISALGPLMFILWILDGDIKNKIKLFFKNRVTLSIILFLIFATISLLWTEPQNYSKGFHEIQKFIRIILLPLLVIATTLKKENIPKVITAFLLGMLVSEIISYGIFFEWWHFKNKPPTDPTPFMHHLDYSTFLAFTSLLLLNKVFFESSLKYKLFFSLYFLFVTANLFINGGRTGQMAFVVSIILVIFLNIKQKLKAILIGVALPIVILITAYSFSPIFKSKVDYGIKDFKESIYSNNYKHSIGTRFGLWNMAIDTFKTHPIVGIGIGDEYSKIDSYIKEQKKYSYIKVHSMHNMYFHYLFTLGLIGLILYLNIWFSVMKINIPNRYYNNLKIIFVSVVMLGSLTEMLLCNQFPMNLFTLFVGVFLSLSIKDSHS